MIFGRHENVNFKFNNNLLDFVQTYKYLGLVCHSAQKQDYKLFMIVVETTAVKALEACFAAAKKCPYSERYPYN